MPDVTFVFTADCINAGLSHRAGDQIDLPAQVAERLQGASLGHVVVPEQAAPAAAHHRTRSTRKHKE